MILSLMLVACSGGHGEGTAVGNPGSAGSLDVVVTGTPDGVTLDVAEAAIDGLSLDDCDGGEAWIAVDDVLDALPGSPDAVAVDGGAWCGLVLSFATDADPLLLEGSTSGGTVFQVALDPGPLTLGENFDVDATELLVEIPLQDTLDPATLEAAGAEVVLAADDPVAVAWASAVASGPQLYEDVDGDVNIGAADLAFDEGSASAMDASSAGCGCTSGGRGAGAWGLGLLAAALWRRRRAGADGWRSRLGRV